MIILNELREIENKLKLYKKSSTLTEDEQQRLLFAYSYVSGTVDSIKKRKENELYKVALEATPN